MANYAKSYDFDLFAERYDAAYGNAVPSRQPGRRVKPAGDDVKKVIELPKEKNAEKAAPKKGRKLGLFKAVVMTLSFALIFGSVITIVYNQVELTELTNEISEQSRALEEANALTVQLTMSASESIKSSEVEKYARETLGMGKITERQVVYINMETEDNGAVIEETNEGFFAKVIEEIKTWFS